MEYVNSVDFTWWTAGFHMTRPTIHPTNLASLWTRSFKFPFIPKLRKVDSENGLAYSFNYWVTWQIALMLNFSTSDGLFQTTLFVFEYFRFQCSWLVPIKPSYLSGSRKRWLPILSLQKKWSFPLKFSSGICGFGLIYWRNP